MNAARLRAALANPTAALRGYRFARRLPAVALPAGPPEPGALERWFDEYSDGPSVEKWRHYFTVYERHLERFVGRESTLVEIGVQRGGSLVMWRDFLGPGCRIHGVDVDPSCREHARDGMEIHIGDQGAPEFWTGFKRAVGPVDILIDDGGHEPHQQITTLEAMLAHLNPGGVYVCEDIHGALQPFNAYVDGLTRSLHALRDSTGGTPSTIHQHIASVHVYPFAIVIEKPATAPRPFAAERRPG